MKKIISYAQNREDVIIDAFFPDLEKGFYVDIGAADPNHDSVTKLFYEKGWSGVNVEPNPQLFKLLELERKRDVNLNIGVSANSHAKVNLRIYDNGMGLSTYSDKLKKQYGRKKQTVTKKYHDVTTDVLSLSDLADKYWPKEVHFMKIDVEGLEYEVLHGNNWEKYRPQLLCIEANHIIKDWHPILEAASYEKVFFDGLNEYFLAKEALGRQDKFAYIENVIGNSVISQELNDEIEELKLQNSALEHRLNDLRKNNRELEDRIAFLNAHIFEQGRTKNLIKRLVINIDQIISRNIHKLTKKPYYYPHFNVPHDVGVNELLSILEQADHKAFQNKPSLSWQIKSFFGGILWAIYSLLRKIVGITGRFMFKRILKPLVRAVKGKR